MCVRIKREGIPETYCLHCAGACGTWRYAFIMMSLAELRLRLLDAMKGKILVFVRG